MNPFFPCNSECALKAFEALAVPHVASGTCKCIGQWAKRWGLSEIDEFKAAKDRLREWPQAPWQHTTFAYSGAMGSVQFHYKNIVTEVASILRSSMLDLKVMCVGGLEWAREE